MATERQKKTLQNLATAPSMAEAMRKAGYKEAYARNPQQLKEKKSWRELLDKYVPEDYVAKKLKEIADAVVLEKMSIPYNIPEEDVHKTMKRMKIPRNKYTLIRIKNAGWEVLYPKPDYTNRNSAVEKIIKSRGGFAPDKIAITDTEGKSLVDEELEKEIERLEKELRLEYIKEAKNGSKSEGKTKKTTSSKEGTAKEV